MLAPPALQSAQRYADIEAAPPDVDRLAGEYAAIGAALESAPDLPSALAAFQRWDTLRRSFLTWANLTELRFRQDTTHAEYASAADRLNQLRPRIEGLDGAIKRRLLDSPLRPELMRELGEHAFALWEADVSAYAPAIEALTVQESALGDEYTSLLASARFDFHGEVLNLPRIGKYVEHPDRELRREAAVAKWAFFAQHREQLDRVFDDLVSARDRMARTLGYSSFTELGYRRMQRTDYGPSDVALFREAIARHIVPLAERMVEAQARTIGVDRIMHWDEGMFDTLQAPAAPQSAAAVIDAGRSAFDALGAEIGGFARLMAERDLLDLDARDGKGGGGFCTTFPTYGLPYVFANFNGTTNDVKVYLHEMGHAFQCYSSRGKRPSDYLWGTAEAGEIHSMSMEFLSWPQAGAFFGADAERFCAQHLKSSILMLPYIAAVDHFQHLVYEHPDASPQRRHAFWKEQEARYLPWRRYGGIEHLERGGFWQLQLHIYRFPFYYIDYALAMSCALQFWMRSQNDPAGTLAEYVALCKRGGELPFVALVQSAGLRSPFEPGVLPEIARQVAQFIGITPG